MYSTLAFLIPCSVGGPDTHNETKVDDGLLLPFLVFSKYVMELALRRPW